MRVLAFGDRNWDNQAFINIVLDKYLDEAQKLGEALVLIQGEARGADKMSRIWAESRGVEFISFPAQWNKYGRAAGPIRNQQQLSEGKPDRGIGFHRNIEHSKGSKDMRDRLRKAGIPVEIRSDI